MYTTFLSYLIILGNMQNERHTAELNAAGLAKRSLTIRHEDTKYCTMIVLLHKLLHALGYDRRFEKILMELAFNVI